MILLRPGKAKINGFSENNQFKDMNRIDGMPTEFEWNIFMSMYNDIAWQEKGNTARCVYNSQTVANYARKLPRGHWSFLGSGSEEKWYGTYIDKHDGSWDQTALKMMANFSESGHPIFRASSALQRGELRSKGAWQEVYTLQR